MPVVMPTRRSNAVPVALRARRLARLLACLLAVVVALLAAAPASASTYPPGGGATLSTDQSVYAPGEPITITAAGFGNCIGQTITFTITPPGGGAPIVVTAIVGPDGTATVVLPGQFVLGTYQVVATCGGVTARTSFRVAELVQAGSDVTRPLAIAGGLTAAGVAMVLVGARRRSDRRRAASTLAG